MGEAALVTISNGALTARINPLGAELWSLTDADGREYMTDADPAFWTGRAPLLFPIVGALKDGRYRLEGAEYVLPKHGFARASRFDPVAIEPSRAQFRLTESEATLTAYPFRFVLDMSFSLDGATLGMTATICNPGKEPLPFSFGFHPAFAWPLPGGSAKEEHVVVFEREEPQDIGRLDGNGLLARRESTPVDGRELALSPSLFEDDALIWDTLGSRRLTCGVPGGTRLDIAFPDMPMLGMWQKPGARYLCIEPWAGIADPADFAGEFGDKPGIQRVEPGGSRSFRMNVTVCPA